MEFLTASNKKGLGDKVEKFDDGTLNAEGKNIVVIGLSLIHISEPTRPY